MALGGAMKKFGSGRPWGKSTARVATNVCETCNETKPACEFYNQAGNKKGIMNVCIPCYIDQKKCRLYGLVPGEYKKMLAGQNYRCASCKEHQDDVGILHIDHCHATGKNRALLCGNCNIALGQTFEDPWRLMQLIKYVRKHNYPAHFGG